MRTGILYHHQNSFLQLITVILWHNFPSRCFFCNVVFIWQLCCMSVRWKAGGREESYPGCCSTHSAFVARAVPGELPRHPHPKRPHQTVKAMLDQNSSFIFVPVLTLSFVKYVPQMCIINRLPPGLTCDRLSLDCCPNITEWEESKLKNQENQTPQVTVPYRLSH